MTKGKWHGQKSIKKKLSYLVMLLTISIFLSCVIYLAGGPKENKNQAAGPQGPNVRIFLSKEDKVVTLPMEEVLMGVLAAEMPASFEMSALEAQAVAARTYIMRRMDEPWGVGSGHADSDICDDPAHCQAYINKEAMQEKWGSNFETYYNKISQAVQNTAGQVLSFDGELIEALYHSTCGGQTEDGGKPYLVSVPCFWDTEAPKYESKVIFTANELKELLNVSSKELAAIQITSRSASGRVTGLSCGEKIFTGSKIRELLGLNSTNFAWLAAVNGSEEEYIFTVQGYGHGIGLCQNGANGMAKEGKSAAEILLYYYQGAEIEKKY